MPAAGRVNDKSLAEQDTHGGPCCAHRVSGPAKEGSPNTFINGYPALRVADGGIHSACCGSNTWKAASGSQSVLINGIAAHRQGDRTKHCGGAGNLIEGSPNVFIGDVERSGTNPEGIKSRMHWIRLVATVSGRRMHSVEMVLEMLERSLTQKTDANGSVEATSLSEQYVHNTTIKWFFLGEGK